MRFILYVCFLVGILFTNHSLMANPNEASLTKFDKRSEAFIAGLDEAEKDQFALIKMGHGVVRAVEHTNAVIQAAVKSCKANNPALKPSLVKAHKDWVKSVSPAVRKANDRVEQLIKKQKFAKPLVVRSYLKEYDEIVKARQAKIKTIPVTAQADCQSLIGKMDDLDTDLISSLHEILQLDKPL